ncbi:MAG: hypothetical protein A3B44_03775 [Candidatus Levybacteria bacterium RIFCSPLOWO2_01_FULL_38_21]|nr:MAG: hypothetical protein A3B44_03775 [Candidatus Levybacteria bacterium RIFCSPLOWO2_01_FULL_38_21]
MKTVEVEHYPFRMDEPEDVIEPAIFDQMEKLVRNPIFQLKDRGSIFNWMQKHFLRCRFLSQEEEELRKRNIMGADLFYHGKEHSVFQTTYNAISTTRAILSRGDKLSSHLTPEGVIAIILAAMYHDTGFVYEEHQRFAIHSSIHVEESKRAATESVDLWGLPNQLNMDRLKKFVVVGIHGTHFPYDEKRATEGKYLINDLPLKDRKEAQIIRLAVQFADWGGQTARIDRYPEGLKRLREEMNACKPGLGTKVIGEDHELEKKRRESIEFVIKKTVGKTGNAFFRTNNHSFAREWYKSSASSR